MKKTTLKCLIKEVLNEINNDLKCPYCNNSNLHYDNENKGDTETMGGLSVEYFICPNCKSKYEKIEGSNDFSMINSEDIEEISQKDIKSPLKKEDHGLGYSHNSTDDYSDVQLVRDPLNDPLLTGKELKEENEKYTFKDYDWLSGNSGLRKPSDVLFDGILLGVIESYPEGYVIRKVISSSDGDFVIINPTEKNNFKSKNLAAKTLHSLWKFYNEK